VEQQRNTTGRIDRDKKFDVLTKRYEEEVCDSGVGIKLEWH
jgi:hypothetical protein